MRYGRLNANNGSDIGGDVYHSLVRLASFKPMRRRGTRVMDRVRRLSFTGI
jgi:hypothetical protein